MLLIVSEIIPPSYTGAGTSAMLIAKYFAKNNRLFAVLTKTKEKQINNQMYISENLIKRVSLFNPNNNLANIKGIKKLVLLGLLIPYYLIYSLIFFLRYRSQFKTILLVSYSWFTFTIAIFAVLFNVPFVVETTLLGQDDPIGYTSDKYKLLKKLMKAFIFKNAKFVTNISPALANRCLDYGLPKTKLRIIPRTLDETKFTITSKNDSIDPFVLKRVKSAYPIILFAGVLNERKGIDIVYKALPHILNKYPKAILLLAGNDYWGVPVSPAVYLHTEKYDSSIIKLGSVENIEDYMNLAHIFFFPSRREGFGRVFIEALACGLPIVCKNIPNVTDYIFENNCAIIINNEDEKEFANAIIKIMNDEVLYNQLKDNGLKCYQSKFSNILVFEQYAMLIEEAFRNK